MTMPAFPATAGQWTIRGDRLRCRLPRHTVELEAPEEVLDGLSQACDGSLDWHAVLRAASAGWSPKSVEAAMASLVEGGALVEATQQLPAAARIGWVPINPSGRLAVADRPAHRAAQQAPLFEPVPQDAMRPTSGAFARRLAKRRTPPTFGSAGLDAQALTDILWALHGVTGHDGRGTVRRTVPSAGGLYAIDWYLALLRPASRYEAGFYKVSHHVEGTGAGAVSLRRLPGSASAAWSCLLMPSILAHAAALVFPVARVDVVAQKYANRALTYALIEVGHALQNGALACVDAGAACAVRGDTVEPEIQRLFALDDMHYPMPAWALGSAPSARQVARARTAESPFRISTVPRMERGLDLSTSLATAGPIRISRLPDFDIWASGRDADARLAVVKAEAEAWERVGWASPDRLVIGAMPDVVSPVDPRELCRYSDTQHRRPGFPFHRFDPGRRQAWVEGVDVGSGAAVSLPAPCVFALGKLAAQDAEWPVTNASTSGIAAWSTRDGAIERALEELVERDAFARAWLEQRALPAVERGLLSLSARQRIADLSGADYDIAVRAMPSEWLPCAIVMARRPSLAFTCVATGAGLTWTSAVEHALLEVETKTQDAHDRQPLSDMDPKQIQSHRGHGQWFRTRRGHADADALVATPTVDAPAFVSTLASTTASLIDRLIAAGRHVFAVDLTPPGASLSQGREPLHVWRVFVPGLVPLWFGHGLEPLGSIADAGLPIARAALRRRPIHPCT